MTPHSLLPWIISSLRWPLVIIKFIYSITPSLIYSEKATKVCKISTLLLTAVNTVKSKGKISQNFVAFSEYMNFKIFCELFSYNMKYWNQNYERKTAFWVLIAFHKCKNKQMIKPKLCFKFSSLHFHQILLNLGVR